MMALERKVVWLCLLVTTTAEIINYYEHNIYPLRPEFLTIPKFGPDDAPKWSPGNGKSYIDLSSIQLSYQCETGAKCPDATFEILMFEEPAAKPWMDYWPDRQFCCTEDMAAAGDCFKEQVGRLLVPTEIPGAFMRSVKIPAGKPISLEQDGTVAHHDITKSGVYILFFGNCDAGSFPVKIHGRIESMDPYGWLPADLFGNLPFYGGLSCLYSIVGIVWLVYCAIYSEQLMALQLWITVVLGMGMVETTTLFAHYLSWNDFGRPTIAVTFVALFFGVLKRSMSRVVMLMVAMGYGVVRPTLGEDMNRVLYLGTGYFLLSLVYTIATSLPAGNRAADESEYDMLSMVVFVLAGVDTTFYIWILTALNNLLGSLAARKQAAKYILYRNFRSVLIVSLLATCVWVLYGSVVNLNTGHGEDNNWKDHWTVDALWEMTYFMIFVAISIMWAPSKNSMRYAYHVELSQLENDDEWQKAGLGDVSNNVTGVQLTAVHGMREGGRDRDDMEYGGAMLDEEEDPFLGSGALDVNQAIAKKQ